MTPRHKDEPSRTLRTAEGRGTLATMAGGLASLLLDGARVIDLDPTERKLVIAGIFFVAGCLVLSRGLSKHGTGL